MAKRHLVDDLRHDATVLSSDGAEVGKLHAVVLDPRDGDVTHVVVNAGPHFPSPGFGAPKLVSVPIDQMEGAEEEDVVLRCSEAEFDAMGSYVERDFLPPPGEEPPPEPEEEGFRPLKTVWNAATALAASFGNQLVGIPVPRETFQVARFERQIVYDSPVWRVEPHEQLGEVERVLVGHDSDEIEAIVVRGGHAFEQDTILPIEHVSEILDGIIRADLSDEDLNSLQPFVAE
jgi:sporulation protein YlmC with PRC-barrel domain